VKAPVASSVAARPRVEPRALAAALWPPACLALGLVLLAAALDLFASDVLVRAGTVMFVNLTLVVGLYVFSGNSGVLSLCHVGFMAIGAYVGSILTIRPALKASLWTDMPGFLSWVLDTSVSPLPALLIAGAVAALVAWAASVPLCRLGGLQAAVASLAVLIIIYTFLVQTDAVTRGTAGVIGVTRWTTLANACAVACVAVLVAYAYQRTSSGRRLRASREDADAARVIGVSVSRERRRAFVLGAFMAGVAGFLYAHFLLTFGPNAFYFGLTFTTVAMLVIGGFKSLSGAVVGVVFVSALTELLRRIEVEGLGPVSALETPGLTEVVLAACLLAVLIRRPDGITGGREPTVGWLRGRVGALRRLAPARGGGR
jgi:branched-chain amino acid transport system permease protein